MSDFDVVVIGAGIHGAGVAQAVAAAGYKVAVLEKNAVGKGTSCKSSKLIHGGLRYLESYQFSLVRKSLKERATLCRLAPSLVKLKPFYIPIYKSTTRKSWQIKLGLSLYALLGGMHKNNLFSCLRHKNNKNLEGLDKSDLKNIYQYFDGQTNDEMLTNAVMKSARELGAKLMCPVKIESINKANQNFTINYTERAQQKKITSKLIVNATGPWVNEIEHVVDNPIKQLAVDLVQGTHIILDIPAPTGIYYLEADDKRAVFVMPYEFENKKITMVGTTEKIFKGKADDVAPTKDEVDYLVDVYKKYFKGKKKVSVLHQFAGLRVLPKNEGGVFSAPRDTILHWATEGLLNLYGGKLTAYRSTSELVFKKIKPLLEKKRRIAFTDQLYLS